MAINKNFVIKNGVQVSTDLIIGDTATNKVGIGPTVPHYDLHVGVARGSRGGIGVTDAVVSGVATINQLSVTGISTFAGALDVNSTVDFAGDVVFNGTNDITYDQSESALVFNDGAAIRVGTGSDFSIMHDGNNTILRERGTGALKILSNSVELLGATAGETLAKFNENGNVELYHDDTKHFEVVAIGATVFGDLTISGVTTSKELNVSSGSTFGDDLNVGFTTFFVDKSTGFVGVGTNVPTATLEIGKTAGTGIGVSIHENGNAGFTGIVTVGGLIDGNGGAHIDNLRLGIDADNDITTSSGNLTLDSAGGTVEINDNLTVDGLLDANAGAHIDNLRLGIDADNDITTSSGNLTLDSTGGTVEVNDNLTVDGLLDANGGAHIDNLRLGIDADNDITTSSGNLTLDSDGGTVQVNDNLTVDGLLDANGGASIDNIQIGVTGDNEIDTSTLNLILDSAGGTINIDDNITVAGVSTFSGIGSFGTDMNVGITTFFVDKSTGRVGVGTNVPTATLEIGKTAGTGIGVSIFENGNACFSGIVTVGGNLIVAGTINLGDADTDNVVFGADVDSHIIPDDDQTYNLGSPTKRWNNLYATNVSAASTLRVVGVATFLDDVRVAGAATVGGALTVTGGAVFNDDTIFHTANSKDIVFDKSANHLIFGDGVGAVLGDDSDFIIQHTSGGNYFEGAGSGSPVYIRAKVNEDQIKLNVDGSVELYHDNAKRFETTGIGITVGLSTVAHNGNAAFAGITTVGTALSMGDSKKAQFGTGGDLTIFHDSTDSEIRNITNDLNIICTGDDINITSADDITIKVQGSEEAIVANGNGDVQLYYNGNLRISTTDDGADFAGTGSIKVPVGTTAQRNASPAAGDFRYNSDEGKFEGYTDSWGEIGGGSVEETDTSVSTTSATSCGSFAKASKRSASILAQITQGSAYQVGRYLVIHDGTTVTTVEESAVATGSMLGTFEGVINGNDVEFRVTMSSSSSATVITKIDSISS